MSTQSSAPPDGNQNRTGPILGMTIGALTLSCIFVGLRMYARLFLTKAARWDDWTIVLALLGTIIGAGLDFPEVRYGFGRHQYYLNDHQVQEFKKYSYGEWVQTFFTLMATKVSICLLLLRISPNKYIIRPIQALIAVMILSNVILSLLWILQCIPVDGAWIAEKQKTAKCFTKGQVQRIIIAQAIISILSDFILSGFPIVILRNVQIKARQKALLCGLMGLGILTAACCIVRTVINWQNDHSDQTWVGVDNFMWRTAEVNIGIAAACMPTFLPIYRQIRDNLTSGRRGSASRRGLFTRFWFSKSGGKTSDSSSYPSSKQQTFWRTHSTKQSRLPSDLARDPAPKQHHPFFQVQDSRDEDPEMQLGTMGTQKTVRPELRHRDSRK